MSLFCIYDLQVQKQKLICKKQAQNKIFKLVDAKIMSLSMWVLAKTEKSL